jgi:hypothetical protein
VPTASAPATPIPQILTPPEGWNPHPTAAHSGAFKADRLWVGPDHKSVILTAHLDLTDLGALDLNSLDALVHQGMIVEAGANNVQPSTHVKICGGKQDGTLTKVTIASTKAPAVKVIEEVALALSDRGYIAEYVRRDGVAEDPAAMRSLLTLCAP